jgi:hypothetical protein
MTVRMPTFGAQVSVVIRTSNPKGFPLGSDTVPT